MKYKLINRKTNEETICDKVVVDVFDYYVSDEKVTEKFEGYLIDDEGFVRHGMSCEKSIESFNGKKVIATNNPSIDLSKVVDEVEMLAEKEFPYNDKRTDYATDECRKILKLGYNKCLETYQFSADDIIEFYDWMLQYQDLSCALRINEVESKKDLLQLWQEQKTKTVWYE